MAKDISGERPESQSLLDRLMRISAERESAQRDGYQELKSRVHRKLLDKLNLESLRIVSRERVYAEIKGVVEELLAQEAIPLNQSERERISDEVLDEVFGFGPLEPLLKDPTISDILVNGYNRVYIERRGKLYKTEVRFKDDQHLMQIIDKIVSLVGRRIDESSPMVDARLPDGSRVNAIIPPLAIDGPALSIRKFSKIPLTAEDLIRNRTLTAPMLELLKAAVRARLNIMISGGAGTGKTTLLNVLSQFIPEDERIITIEDAAELQLHQEHVVRLETRPPNIEGKGAIRQRQLLINSLRMRPDRIIIGEVRGDEAIDMLQAMNTGHDGSLTTIHANSPRDALARLETMVAMGEVHVPERAIRYQIASAINLVIQIARLSDGTRKIVNISEIVGMEGDVISMQDIFVFEKLGVSEGGRVLGRFRATGIRPKFSERLKAAGIFLPANVFESVVEIT